MKKRILSLLLAFFVMVSMIPSPVFAEDGEKEVMVMTYNPSLEAMAEAENVELYRGGELYLSAVLREDVSGEIQWQIEAGEDFWVDIQGGTAEELRVSYGMVKSVLNNDAARMRCVVAAGDGVVYSDAVTVTVTDVDNRVAAGTFTAEQEFAAPAALPAPTAVSSTYTTRVQEATEPTEAQVLAASVEAESASTSGQTSEDTTIYTVTIEYVYADSSKFKGQRVALPYIAEVAEGSSLTETVISPSCVGYAPDENEIALSIDSASKNVSYTVYYAPAQVSYTVRHYQQNVDDDDYTWVDTTMATGYTEALTNDAAEKSYTGFTALTHYHEEIAADSSTMIDIYYDRNYYLMSFELDGGYGVEAVYARYGAEVSVADPKKAGYSFENWLLDGAVTELPDTMPAENRQYTAKWTPGNATYTVAYWLQDADDPTKYNYWLSRTDTGMAGESAKGEDDVDEKLPGEIESIKQGNNTWYPETDFYNFNSDLTTKEVEIKGDGSTVVNVYYDRNVYKLRFYYARYHEVDKYWQITHSTDYYNGTVSDLGYWNTDNNVKPELFDGYTEEHSEQPIGNFTYYYFTLTARYGQNLEKLWPENPIKNAESMSATDFSRCFVSWATEPDSGYYKSNSNKNIKGPYSKLDANILTSPTVVSPDVNHDLVAFYGTPTMYTYEIYYSLLQRETAEREYGDDKSEYKKVTTYTVGSQDNPSGQSPLAFSGVTNVGKDYDNNNKYDGNVVRFYYKRNEHTVTFDDSYGTVTKQYTVPYGGTLSDYITAVPTPAYPDELPAGAYEFDGWYQSKDGVGPYDSSITMPDKELIYYAKWNPKVYTVTMNDGNGNQLGTDQVSYGNTATKPADPTMENATFIGWYYVDENGEEQRFDFDNMTITQDMTIYAKWRSNLMKEVEIHYVVTDENGKQTQIANTETMMLRVGQARTFDAKTGNSLYEAYRTGCFPMEATKSVTPTAEDAKNEEPLKLVFEYRQYEKVPYQVEFYIQLDVDADNDGELDLRPAFKEDADGNAVFMETYEADAEVYVEQHWDNDKAVVTELYAPDNLADPSWKLPNAYTPDALKIQHVIVPDTKDPEGTIAENNKIKFIYTYEEPETDEDGNTVYRSRYLVQHFVESSTTPDEYSLYSYSDEEGLSGDTASASPISIPGYAYSYDVTNTKKQNETGFKDEMFDVLSGEIKADDSLELNFYYTVNPYPYQVMYLEDGSNRVLKAAKTTDENNNLLTAFYGAKVTETAVDIEGYDVVGASEKSIYIEMEAEDTANVNTIVFYYARKSADLIISKRVELDPDQADEEGIDELPDDVLAQEFTFTITNAKGFHKSVYDYTITNSDQTTTTGKVSAGTTTMTVTLKHGQMIAIHDLAMGSYTVTETYVPGFRTSVDGTIQQAFSVTLNNAGEDKTAAFVNAYPFYTGDLVLLKEVIKADSSDPSATEPYNVTVTLHPDDTAREVDRVITWTNGDGTEKTYTIPALTNTDKDLREFTFDVQIPVRKGTDGKVVGELVLTGVPVGTFTVEEKSEKSGYITDFYKVTYNKALHKNDEVTGTNHIVNGEIHGGHPTAVTFHNTYKKGSLTINKTVKQEYEKDNWQSDTFSFQITGTTELPNGDYKITVGGVEHTVTVTDGKLTLTDTIQVEKPEDTTQTEWTNSLTFANLPAGYYTVTESASTGGLDQYTIESPAENQLVNDTANATQFDFTNTYKRHLGKLTITKTVNGGSDDDTFIFHISGNGVDMDVAITGSGSVTIHDLPLGTYTVTEDTDWSWRYTATVDSVAVNSASKELKVDAPDATVTFTNTYSNSSWLNYYSNLPNVFPNQTN